MRLFGSVMYAFGTVIFIFVPSQFCHVLIKLLNHQMSFADDVAADRYLCASISIQPR